MINGDFSVNVLYEKQTAPCLVKSPDSVVEKISASLMVKESSQPSSTVKRCYNRSTPSPTWSTAIIASFYSWRSYNRSIEYLIIGVHHVRDYPFWIILTYFLNRSSFSSSSNRYLAIYFACNTPLSLNNKDWVCGMELTISLNCSGYFSIQKCSISFHTVYFWLSKDTLLLVRIIIVGKYLNES